MSSSIGQLRQYLGQFNTHEAIRVVGAASQYLLQSNQVVARDFSVPMTPWSLAFLAKEILCHSSDKSVRAFDSQVDLERALMLYEDLPDPLFRANPSDDPFAHYKAILRIVNLQYPFQESLYRPLCRAAIIFDDIASEISRGPILQIPDLVHSELGLTPTQIIRIGLLIGAQISAGKNIVANFGALSRSPLGSFSADVNSENLLKFGSRFAIEIPAFRVRVASQPELSGYEKFAFNQLRQTPLISIDERHHYVPSALTLIHALSDGLFYACADALRGEDKKNAFLTKFGYVFENYVGKLLSSSLLGWRIEPEPRYGNSAVGPDWVCVREDQAVLIQCRLGTPSARFSMFADSIFLENHARKTFREPVEETAKFLAWVSQNDSSIEWLVGVKRFYALNVTYFPLYHANSIYREMFLPVEYESNPVLCNTQFAWIGEFENLLASIASEDFARVLARKEDATGLSLEEFSNSWKSLGIQPRVHAVLREKLRQLIPGLLERNEDLWL